MTTDEPREGRQLPGAKTSEEERAGIEELLVKLIDGVVQPEHEAAPAGDVHIVIMNQGTAACGFTMSYQPAETKAAEARGPVAEWHRIGPGEQGETVIDLVEGDYILASLDLDGAVVSTATLVVQPQQGLPGSEELRRIESGGRH
jgi:hypothetical protein